MRILFFDWNEFTGPDCREVLKRLGHNVGTFKHLWNCRSVDPLFTERTAQALMCVQAAGPDGRDYTLRKEATPQWDLVFSFNYYPVISEVCQDLDVPYLSWTFDSPYLPVTSETNKNPVNRILLFDRALAERMRAQGVDTVRYQPLCINGRRMDAIRKEVCGDNRHPEYPHAISFVGGLYADKNNFYNDIAKDLPVMLRAYLEDVMNLQTGVFGQDLIGDETLVTPEQLNAVSEHIRLDVPDVYHIDRQEFLRDLLRTQATEMDRFSLLEALGRQHPGEVDLYTRWDSPPLPGVRNLGYADYLEKMPRVFIGSRINLNITLRTIRTGMPLRALDVLGAGGFLLSTWQEELAEYFEQGRDLVMARDPEEFLFLAEWFLTHDGEREKIAARGCASVREQFDYERILPELLRDYK